MGRRLVAGLLAVALGGGSTGCASSIGEVRGSVSPLVQRTHVQDGPLIELNGTQEYIHGANLPWYSYGQDFGGGSEGEGASSPTTNAAVDTALAAARDAGMNVVRWWLFPGEPTQFTLDDAGLPVALRPEVFEDIDAALELATRNDITYVFTIFSHPAGLPTAWTTTEEGRERLTAALGELFSRYGSDPRIVTWDVINEPEWDVWNDNISEDDVRDLISSITAAAHASSVIPVTVGAARRDGLAMLTGLGLDYYTVHWYDAMTAANECLPCVTAAEVQEQFGFDEPLVVGEFSAGPDQAGRFELWRDLGYAGSMAWSLFPDLTADRLPIDLDAAAAFAKQLD